VRSRSRAGWYVRRPERALVFGHRGAPNTAIENTLSSFAAAAQEGADGIELDVRRCASGELVAAHDATLARCTRGADHRAIAELPYRELQAIDLGAGERIPLLSDVLAFARVRRLFVNIEMKRDVPDRRALAEATACALRSWDPVHGLLVSSFDRWMLSALRIRAPKVPTALLLDRGSNDAMAGPIAAFLGFAAVHLERTIASAARIRKLRRRGLAVAVWTVNAEREALDFEALEVDAVITDSPKKIRAALA
jgi:glycerophosphoryl diester phosphodiesterase